MEVRRAKSSLDGETNHVPQDLVLRPLLFNIYFNDHTEGILAYINMLVYDAKMLRMKSCRKLENYIGKL